jgi:hypothetical protein
MPRAFKDWALDAQKPARPFAFEVKLEDQPHRLCFDRVDEGQIAPLSTGICMPPGE